jgi:hypothetical protein
MKFVNFWICYAPNAVPLNKGAAGRQYSKWWLNSRWRWFFVNFLFFFVIYFGLLFLENSKWRNKLR